MRKRARRSELTWGCCLHGWLEDAGLKSSTAGAAWAGAVRDSVVCANASWPASRGSNMRPIDAAFMTVLLGPETNVGPPERLARCFDVTVDAPFGRGHSRFAPR